jgi:uncharacterized protein YbjT (DUF2867 family)
MPATAQTVLVTGATGKQGGATARALLDHGRRVRVLVRDPGAPRVRSLVAAGAEPVVGDMLDPASLDAAMEGAHGVFSVQPAESPFSPVRAEDEVRMGTRVAEAASAAGVRHFVYTSVGGAERNSGIPNWESKWRIETAIRALRLPATILRPVDFMENFAGPYSGIGSGEIASPVPPDSRQQLIAVEDIGAIAALAFADPDHYLGRAVEIAGDEMPRAEVAAVISRALGRTIPFRETPVADLARTLPQALPYRAWFVAGGYAADLPAVRALHPGILTLEAWLDRTGRELIAAALPEAGAPQGTPA